MLIGNGSQITSVQTAVTSQYVTGLTSSNVTTALGYVPLNSNSTAISALTSQYVTGLTSSNVTTALGYVPLNSNSTALTSQYVTQSNQANITLVGTLLNVTVSGNSNFNDVFTNNITPYANANANIGSATLQYNTVFARATSAQYADLAELYKADFAYPAGTVMILGGAEEITITNEFANPAVIGAISLNPAYLMNNKAGGLPVALRGRVFIYVSGKVAKGDLLVTSQIPGAAISVGKNTDYGVAIFAKAIESKDSTEVALLEALIL
jgi:hypothetical protein